MASGAAARRPEPHHRKEGKVCYVEVNGQDLPYFRVVPPDIRDVENEAERRQVLAAINVANRSAKVAKMHMTSNDDNVMVSVELLLPTPHDFKAAFTRALETMDFAVGLFLEAMRGK